MVLHPQMNRKPPELHIVDGTKSRTGNNRTQPEGIKKRIPQAEWMDNPEAWNKIKFVDDTSQFLLEVYGIGNDQDKTTLYMLAEQVDLFVKCTKGIAKNGIVSTFNNGQTIGPNPYIGIRNKAHTLIIQTMNELGLTPRSRLSAGKVEESSPLAQFLKGPLAQ